MRTVYKVENTRLILPNSAWSANVIEKLTQMGHHVEITDEDPDLCVRGEAEKTRMHELLDSVGL